MSKSSPSGLPSSPKPLRARTSRTSCPTSVLVAVLPLRPLLLVPLPVVPHQRRRRRKKLRRRLRRSLTTTWFVPHLISVCWPVLVLMIALSLVCRASGCSTKRSWFNACFVFVSCNYHYLQQPTSPLPLSFPCSRPSAPRTTKYMHDPCVPPSENLTSVVLTLTFGTEHVCLREICTSGAF